MKGLVGLLLSIGISSMANAAIMIEPMVGYATGSTKCTDVSGGDCASKETGTMFGARVGYKSVLGLWSAVEYDSASGKSKPDDGSSSSDFTFSTAGLTVGADLLFLRLFAGYGFMNSATFKSSSGSSKMTGGSTVKVGAGYKFPGLPLAVNLEYMMIEFKTVESGGQKYAVKDLFSTLKENIIAVTVSAPFSF